MWRTTRFSNLNVLIRVSVGLVVARRKFQRGSNDVARRVFIKGTPTIHHTLVNFFFSLTLIATQLCSCSWLS